MARIRTIKPEFWTDEKIINLPYEARLLFIGLWNFADDYGCLDDKPDQLRLMVLPNELGLDVAQLVDLLITAELLDRYVDEENDKTYLVIKNWTKHQKVDHPTKSKIQTASASKVNVPLLVRRKIAEKYSCKPGETKECSCYFCNEPGRITWHLKSNGTPSNWVTFNLEISHLKSEHSGGKTDENNLILACRNCNRSMGVKDAFDWLFNSSYSTNQTKQNIIDFREKARIFEKSREDSLLIGKEGKGLEGKGISPADKPQVPKKSKKVSTKKNEEAEPYWQKLVDEWFFMNQKIFGAPPSFTGKDARELKKLIGLLKARAKLKQVEWTEAIALQRFTAFLEEAYKDPWICKNFLLNNLVSQFDKIILNHSQHGTANRKNTSGAVIPIAGGKSAGAVELIERLKNSVISNAGG